MGWITGFLGGRGGLGAGVLLCLAGGLAAGCGTGPELEEAAAAPRRAFPLPFSRGINFSGWFEAASVRSIPFTAFTEEDFAQAKSLGLEAIRLPINLHRMTGGPPGYTIDPLLFELLDQAVDWAEKYGLYIILDNHSFDPVKATDPAIGDILFPVWEQMACHYRDRSDLVIYEILNEPHGIDDALWGKIQGEAVERIRRLDTRHRIVVGGSGYNSAAKLFSLPPYEDPLLIYTFHFYEPYLFTHQGETWGSPPNLGSLRALPFPPDPGRMPPIPPNLKNTWVEENLRNRYFRDGQEAALAAALDRVTAFSNSREVPVFCGEWGVYMKNSLDEDRIRWYRLVAGLLEARNIARASWDYFGGFGIFTGMDGGSFPEDLNRGLLAALGLKPPPRNAGEAPPFPQLPLTLYDDYPARGLSFSFWGDASTVDLYDRDPAEGTYALRWENAAQYDAVQFTFRKPLDLGRAAAPDQASLVFEARSSGPLSFEVRFLNPEEPESVPWRCSFTVGPELLPPDRNWHTLRIPLAAMTETGAWINGEGLWKGPEGKFSWARVRTLQFAAEKAGFPGQALYLDSVRIESVSRGGKPQNSG